MPSREVARAHICAHLFNLATPATSLLVVENVRQHLTNGIEPPRSRPAPYAEYRRLGDDWHKGRKHSNECRQFDRLNKLAAGWRDLDLQARRDLALALTELADRRRAKIGRFDSVVIADYQRAMRLHREILTGRWDGWFNQSHILALTDLNRIIAMLRENGIAAGREFQLDPRLVRPIDADLRVVLTWDDDAVDLNLIIQKPNGEGSSPIFDARTGGVHVDSSGYGPAEYVERKALKGRYEIDVIYVDTSGRALLGPTTARHDLHEFRAAGRTIETSEGPTRKRTR